MLQISDRTPRQVSDETISAGDTRYNFASRGVAQLVAHLLWEQEAGSSSLLSPTNSLDRLGKFSLSSSRSVTDPWHSYVIVSHEHFQHLH